MIKDKIQIIKKYKKAYKNYFIILLKIYFNRKNSQKDNIMIEVKLKDGKKMNIPYEWVWRFSELNNYVNKNISNVSLTEDGILFYYKCKWRMNFCQKRRSKICQFRRLNFYHPFSFFRKRLVGICTIWRCGIWLRNWKRMEWVFQRFPEN